MKGIKAFLTVLFIMPLGHALTVLALKLPEAGQVTVAGVCIVGAALIMYATNQIQSPAWTTFTGMLAGVLLWAGLVEIGVKLGAEAIDIEELKAMEFSLAIIIPLLLYFLFNENVRCNLFVSCSKTSFALNFKNLEV